MKIYGDGRDHVFSILIPEYVRQVWNKCGETSKKVGHAAFENTYSGSRIRKRPYFLRESLPAFDRSVRPASLGLPRAATAE